MGSTSTARTMKAGQWEPKQKKVVINEIPVPAPGPHQVLVKITSASLCHTDIMAIDDPDREEPLTLGHEGVGVISQLHPSAEGKGFKVGDAIGFLYILGCCFECEGCMVHQRLCLNGKPEMQGWSEPGFFSEYAIVDYRNAIHLPKHWSLKTSSVFFCAGMTAFNAVDSCELQPGQWLGVIGAGGLGQLATQYAKAMGLNVLAIDINDKTLEVCKAQGADAIFNSRTDQEYVSKVKDLTKGGVHAAAVFSNAKIAYVNSLNIIRVGGLLMVIGLPDEPLEVSTMDLALAKYRIKSDSPGIPRRLKKAVDFSAKHNIAPEVELRKLEELDDMVNEMRAGTATKRMAVAFD
ncbi:hypothetical protein A1O3_04612 [Capronia epimyces CBS 606.96]|uniref:Enoyl reductase (ER) domain-containing protein n=1 Tax=Capronia epimyces CBS 606.96 TaxID=1182542 RepID=W9Y2U8_9EURO|nr:uncharacterized protein A1O3_04612 [Capronia epimyces CBS 606.96]EXJ83945.1 hypothetical protein A1O3_04612 [Capronia epimyces CBS 606.96]